MALESAVGRRFRVGLVVLIALVFIAIGVLMVGKRAHLFTKKLPYQTQFDSAAGLVSGNPVRLNGVTVGNVLEVNLSPDPADQRVRVVYDVDRAVAPRLRTGTRASIKTIGLLGDKYVELVGGTAQEPVVPPEGEIKAAPGAAWRSCSREAAISSRTWVGLPDRSRTSSAAPKRAKDSWDSSPPTASRAASWAAT